MIKNNNFGNLLEKILLIAKIKNGVVARTLQYDVSYISKWISGKSVPSRKNIDEVCGVISDLVVQGASDIATQQLVFTLGSEDKHLREDLKKALLNGYHEATGTTDNQRYANNASLCIRPHGQFSLLLDYAKEMNTSGEITIGVLVDLFALDHRTKLILAGIEDNRFRITNKREDIHVHFIMDRSKLKGDSIYDVILLIHLLTNFSLLDFNLTHSKFASGKGIFSVLNQYGAVSIFDEQGQFFSTVSTKDTAMIQDIYQGIMAHHNPEQSIFIHSTMNEMLERHDYIQSLLSQNVKWLVGHITEQFISKELFDQLCDDLFGHDPLLRREAGKTYLLAKHLIEKNQVKIMVYQSALNNFMLTGELDFFNQKIVLTPKERKTQLTHIKELFERTGANHVKIVDGGFSEDFRHITNPCIFLSDSTDYLRLENNYYDKNILIIYDKELQQTFHEFFDTIWNKDLAMVISDHRVISQKLDKLIHAAELLNDVD